MKQFISDLRKYWYFAIYSAKTDLKAEVANSYLNWIWWVLEPFLNMLVYTFVFKNLFPSDKSFPVFIYSGLMFWNFFNRTISYSVKLVRSNKDIVTKVYVPKFILLIGNMFLNAFKMLVGLTILIPLIIIYKVEITWTALMIIPLFILLFVFSFGCGSILMHFGVFVDDLAYAVGILLNMLMFLSGVFYDLTTGLPEGYGKILGTFNPVACIIDALHQVLLNGTMPNMVTLGAWTVISIVMSIIGIRVVYKYENSYVKVI